MHLFDYWGFHLVSFQLVLILEASKIQSIFPPAESSYFGKVNQFCVLTSQFS